VSADDGVTSLAELLAEIERTDYSDISDKEYRESSLEAKRLKRLYDDAVRGRPRALNERHVSLPVR
jgi:hypothetical protein